MKRRGSCPRCHYIGNRHLCACVGAIGRALKENDPALARRLYVELVADANREERELRCDD